MIFRGLKPIEVNDPVIEVVTDDRWYDLHNAGWIRSIALEAPADLVLVIDYLEPERQGIATGPDGVLELRFVNVSMLSVAQYEDNVPENTTLEHLVYWPPRAGERCVEIRTGTLEIQFSADETRFRVLGPGDLAPGSKTAIDA
jgi:hypothetical protein